MQARALRIRSLTAAGFAVAVAVAATAAAGENGGGEKAPPRPAVRVAPVGVIDRTQAKTLVGTVAGSERVTVNARVSGTLEKVSFREGGLVKKGEPLFQIEDTVYKAKHAAALAAAAQAKAELELARRDHDRQKALMDDNAISQSTYDNTFYKVELCAARLKEAEANVTLAEQDLAYTRIAAEVDGRIGEKSLSEGNYVTPASGTLATVVRFDPAHVKFTISQADYFRHFGGHEIRDDSIVEIVRADGELFRGRAVVDLVDNEVDGRTDTIMIRLVCENPDYQLLPGGHVQIRLARRFEKPLTAVMVQAIMTDGRQRYVYVVGAEDKIERRVVEVGEQVHGMQAVLSGLASGERVVTGGLNKVRPGQAVDAVAEE